MALNHWQSCLGWVWGLISKELFYLCLTGPQRAQQPRTNFYQGMGLLLQIHRGLCLLCLGTKQVSSLVICPCCSLSSHWGCSPSKVKAFCGGKGRLRSHLHHTNSCSPRHDNPIHTPGLATPEGSPPPWFVNSGNLCYHLANSAMLFRECLLSLTFLNVWRREFSDHLI